MGIFKSVQSANAHAYIFDEDTMTFWPALSLAQGESVELNDPLVIEHFEGTRLFKGITQGDVGWFDERDIELVDAGGAVIIGDVEPEPPIYYGPDETPPKKPSIWPLLVGIGLSILAGCTHVKTGVLNTGRAVVTCVPEFVQCVVREYKNEPR